MRHVSRCTLVHGDVTALRQAEVGSGFRLVLDTGTFHGLTAAKQEAMGREVSAICADDATVLLDCFAPRRRGPLPRGANRADVERAFPGWEITDVEVADTEPDALARLFKFDERFYRLRRESTRLASAYVRALFGATRFFGVQPAPRNCVASHERGRSRC